MKYLVLVGILATAAGRALSASETSDPRAELSSAIEHALQLLQDEEYTSFLEQLAVPADLKRALDSRDLPDLAAAFAKEKARPLIAVLQQIRDSEPELSEDGKLAVFAVKAKQVSRAKIVFQKIDGLWYLQN